jgi:hypothetical protein
LWEPNGDKNTLTYEHVQERRGEMVE